MNERSLTNTLMHHVDLQRKVLFTNAVLRRRVHVELLESEIGSREAGCSVEDDFESRSEILEFGFLLWDVENWGFGCKGDGFVWEVGMLAFISQAMLILKPVDIPMLIGDWLVPVLQASFSGSRAAQLKGPIRPVYPKVLTLTASPS